MKPLCNYLPLLLGLCLLLLPLSSFAATPEQVVIHSKMGDVTFPHRKHEGRATNCETCHHMGVEAGNCSKCHLSDPEAPKPKDAYHRLCKGCHAEKRGPSGCKDCHKK